MEAEEKRRDLVQFAQYADFVVRLVQYFPSEGKWDMVLAKYNNRTGAQKLWNRTIEDEAELQEWINEIERELVASPV
jgi:hypothetical protein